MKSEVRVFAGYHLHPADHRLTLHKGLWSLRLAASHDSLQQHIVKAAGPSSAHTQHTHTQPTAEINPFSPNNTYTPLFLHYL